MPPKKIARFRCCNPLCDFTTNSQRGIATHNRYNADCKQHYEKVWNIFTNEDLMQYAKKEIALGNIKVEHIQHSKTQQSGTQSATKTSTAGQKTTGLNEEEASDQSDMEMSATYAWAPDSEVEERYEVLESDSDETVDMTNGSDGEIEANNNIVPENRQTNVLPNFETIFDFSKFHISNFNNETINQIITQRQSVQQTTQTLQNGIAFLMEDKHEIRLLNMLNNANVPHFLFREIQKWAFEAQQDGYDFYPQRTTRKAEIKYLQRWLNLKDITPQQVTCYLPGPDKESVPVTRFDFSTQLMSLLSDRKLVGNLDNLDVNLDDPFSRYVSPGNILSCVNSGQWYNDAYDYCIKDPNDFLCPIIFAIDESKLQGGGRTGAQPILFSTSLFNQKLRNTSLVWRPLGYIYDLDNIETQIERKAQGNDLKYSRFHSVIAKVLETFVFAQRSNVLSNVELTIGNFTKIVNIKVPCAFIIGDIQGGDKMCCSSPSYDKRLERICRKCNVRGFQVGDANVQCQRIRMDRIKQMILQNETEALAKLNQYVVYNAWFEVDFGGCVYGIFSAAMAIEPLHSLENGLIPDCLTVLFEEELNNKNWKTSLDQIAKKMKLWDRQHFLTSGSNKEMPSLLWKNGITNITLIPAKEKVGLMLTVIVISLTDEGQEFFNKRLSTKGKCSDMRYVFEMLLAYWSWLKKPSYWKRNNPEMTERYKTSIRNMLAKLYALWPREKGNGWQKPKFHEQLHVPDDIERNGSPAGTHSGPTEHNHIEFVKNPARRTQRRQINLDQQIAARFTESYVIRMAHETLENSQKETNNNSNVTSYCRCYAARIALFKSLKGNGKFLYQFFIEEQSLKGWKRIDQNVFDVIGEQLDCMTTIDWNLHNHNVYKKTISMYTEYKRNDKIFRSHPDYRSEGEWHDWVMVRWDGNPEKDQPNPKNLPISYQDEVDEKKYCYTPCKIVGLFFEIEDQFGKTEAYAVVWPCDYKFSKFSVFTTTWKLNFKDKQNKKPDYYLINCNSIVRHCLMIPEKIYDEKNSIFYTEVWPRELWGDEF